jgi:hypothetical protein
MTIYMNPLIMGFLLLHVRCSIISGTITSLCMQREGVEVLLIYEAINVAAVRNSSSK